ncbi:hypothetical protein C8Q79DRAFT_870770, partial [Trametes meyenii]
YQVTLSKIISEKANSARAASLTHAQKYIKHGWDRLSTVPIKGAYSTDVTEWICNCGAQKYHVHLMCKHLVHAAGEQDPNWWPTVVRYHVRPFYTIPIDKIIPDAPESIRDHAWLEHMSTPASSDAGYLSERPSSPIMSLPGKAPHTGPNGLMYTRAGGSAGFDLDDEDERDTDNTIELLRYATDTLDGQRDNPEEGFFDCAKAQMSATIRWAYGLDKTTNP